MESYALAKMQGGRHSLPRPTTKLPACMVPRQRLEALAALEAERVAAEAERAAELAAAEAEQQRAAAEKAAMEARLEAQAKEAAAREAERAAAAEARLLETLQLVRADGVRIRAGILVVIGSVADHACGTVSFCRRGAMWLRTALAALGAATWPAPHALPGWRRWCASRRRGEVAGTAGEWCSGASSAT